MMQNPSYTTRDVDTYNEQYKQIQIAADKEITKRWAVFCVVVLLFVMLFIVEHMWYEYVQARWGETPTSQEG